ncbi:ATP-binding protein [Mycolicibacterium aichiense]|uniref:Anti-sigma regulatory factor n=1 Tax=Mycolicibacterium aichiense TaxID=1799 RepID=A0AAD1MC32_9MYCO|nr:ATP-binding protein [Mycolicibacterium aichiense]MCV7018607.1 ATP-binding protein [Mycolicibacterium aichiense]BBX07366.1 anti-sigma regulatory factor [Mycolicibacterium aichiense]STZ81180.1 putative anti-sigma regulatory factor [Mycolicibacterium aichiense]
MTTPSYPSHTADGDRFARNDVVADAHNAAMVRDEFATWLRACGDIDRVRFSDVVLAVNEALANTAEFAYLLKGGVGTIDLEAVRDGDTLTVTIADQGQWRESTPATQSRTRGRGIPLMRALADDVTIDSSALGTTVCLRFEQVHAVQESDDDARVG